MGNFKVAPVDGSTCTAAHGGPSHDSVNAPKHYMLPGLGVEWIDIRAALLKGIPEGTPFEAVTSWSEAITYLARMWGKNGVEDARKAEFYIKRMITLLVDV